jgi:hypothetical protein
MNDGEGNTGGMPGGRLTQQGRSASRPGLADGRPCEKCTTPWKGDSLIMTQLLDAALPIECGRPSAVHLL